MNMLRDVDFTKTSKWATLLGARTSDDVVVGFGHFSERLQGVSRQRSNLSEGPIHCMFKE